MREVRYCRTCLMPDTRPRIEFTADGVCNACVHAQGKKTIDWKARRREFEELVLPYRSRSGSWDAVVPWSGGKDSSSIAWRLKFEYGMNPLLVTFSPLLPNDVGNHNREQMLRAGFDHVFFRPNQKVHRFLSHRFFRERGNPKVAWDAGVNAIPIQVAVGYGIPLVFYAEHGETEYGGKVLHEESSKIRDFTEVLEHQVGDDPRNWVDGENVRLADLNPYLYPDAPAIAETGVKALYFAWFFRWSMFENHQYIRERIDFRPHPKGRTQGTFTDFDSLDDKSDDLYYYMQYVKFGFGRAVRDASRMIQNGHLTREEGLELARKYDGEFPSEHLDAMLEYLSMTREECLEIVDLHRNPEIWKKEGGEWTLRHPLR
ncbi:MAG: N-acetyl sugar amidotransferase [Planctomycetes bacterium]|nr:N-acetyl sugar amidotransferase [Planctomycetota bacterium]